MIVGVNADEALRVRRGVGTAIITPQMRTARVMQCSPPVVVLAAVGVIDAVRTGKVRAHAPDTARDVADGVRKALDPIFGNEQIDRSPALGARSTIPSWIRSASNLCRCHVSGTGRLAVPSDDC